MFYGTLIMSYGRSAPLSRPQRLTSSLTVTATKSFGHRKGIVRAPYLCYIREPQEVKYVIELSKIIKSHIEYCVDRAAPVRAPCGHRTAVA